MRIVPRFGCPPTPAKAGSSFLPDPGGRDGRFPVTARVFPVAGLILALVGVVVTQYWGIGGGLSEVQVYGK